MPLGCPAEGQFLPRSSPTGDRPTGTSVARPKAAITGILTLAVAGGIGGWVFLRPAGETGVQESADLTGEMEPQIVLFQILEDSEVPDGLSALKVGESDIYVMVTVFYPGLPSAPEPSAHRLTSINGDKEASADPLAVESDVDDDGARVDLYFRVAGDFEIAQLLRGKTIVAANLELEAG